LFFFGNFQIYSDRGPIAFTKFAEFSDG
jgi:hypothetical protein